MTKKRSQTITIEQVPVDDLRLDPTNPRRISDAQLESLTHSIQRFGLVDPIIARRNGQVIGGHQRLIAARRLGHDIVPVVYVELSDEQARLLGLALNRISGDWDNQLLARLLSDLQEAPDVDISLAGFEDDEIQKLLKTIDARDRRHREETFDVAAAIDAAKRDPGVERGDMWQLGDHRIMCGDSADAGDVAGLMGGVSARLIVTDPPYGVEYAGSGRAKRKRIDNDHLGADQASFWTEAFRHWPLNGDAYVFSPSGPLISKLCASVVAAGIDHHQWLIWVKDRLVLGRSHYHYRHEHIFYGWKGKSSWNGSRKQDSVWQETRPDASPEHPTIKPVPLCERGIENSSSENDVVVDPFLGSGTTLIAAERTGRRCYGMELDPHYCRVVIARWEAFSGQSAEKVSERPA